MPHVLGLGLLDFPTSVLDSPLDHYGWQGRQKKHERRPPGYPNGERKRGHKCEQTHHRAPYARSKTPQASHTLVSELEGVQGLGILEDREVLEVSHRK